MGFAYMVCTICKRYSDDGGLKSNLFLCHSCLDNPSLWVIDNSNINYSDRELVHNDYQKI